jgi:hypothetical protein
VCFPRLRRDPSSSSCPRIRLFRRPPSSPCSIPPGGIDPEQLVDRFVQQMPTASKRGKINKARPLGRARLMTRKKETINGEGTNAPLSVQRLVNAIAIDDRNNPSCVSTSATHPPPPPDVCSSDLRHRCRHRDGDFIVGNSNIPGG